MEKIAFILAVLTGFMFTNICCNINNRQDYVEEHYISADLPMNKYGAYLSGRVAHIRHNLNKAADYYIIASETAPKNQMLPSQLYVMLTSQGRVDEAVKYADLALKDKDNSPFIYTIKSVHSAKEGDFTNAIKEIKSCNTPFAQDILNPIIIAWSYAGLSQYDQAMRSLYTLFHNKQLRGMYLLHAGAISDYMGRNKEADVYYSALMQNKSIGASAFPLQIISNFYLRQKRLDKVKEIIKMASVHDNPAIKQIVSDTKQLMKHSSDVSPVIDSPSIGIADALFGIALILQGDGHADEIALLFASLATYSNPQYDIPKILMGNILDSKELYREANEIYAQISAEQPNYFIAQFQIAKNLIALKSYSEAEAILRKLIRQSPQNHDLYTNLGEIMRFTKRYHDAIIYYQNAIDLYPEKYKDQSWLILLAQAAAYDASGDKENTEKILRDILEMHPNYLVKNHLGYTLVRNQKNMDEAFELIIDAYNEAPNEGSVIDSLGWALYQIGYYQQAVKYLEQASDLSPSEAIIYDHLGDAYWEVGRKNEAVFQWNHALSTRDDSEEIDRELIKHKISHGKPMHQPVEFDKEKIDSMIPQD